MSKLWLTFMTGPEEVITLEEAIEPVWRYTNGINCTFHGDSEHKSAKYIQNVIDKCGGGKIIYLPYSGRHDFSRNAYLFCGCIEQDNWCIQTDILEHLNSNFCFFLPRLIKTLEEQAINGVFYYGKILLYKYHESIMFNGSPHEGFNRRDGNLRAIELSHTYPNEKDVRLNVRSIKRNDPFHWVGHYAKYMLLPWGTNHGLLGIEHRGDPNVLFPQREKLRLEFIEEMRRRGFQINIDGLTKMFSGIIDDKLKHFINSEKVWNDFYRYMVLGDKTVQDEHKWETIKKI